MSFLSLVTYPKAPYGENNHANRAGDDERGPGGQQNVEPGPRAALFPVRRPRGPSGFLQAWSGERAKNHRCWNFRCTLPIGRVNCGRVLLAGAEASHVEFGGGLQRHVGHRFLS